MLYYKLYVHMSLQISFLDFSIQCMQKGPFLIANSEYRSILWQIRQFTHNYYPRHIQNVDTAIFTRQSYSLNVQCPLIISSKTAYIKNDSFYRSALEKKILPSQFIILNQMKSNRNPKTKKPVKFDAYEIKTSLPFKITSTFIRASLRYERDGHWNQRQKIKYSIFISYFRHLFQEPKKNKTIRLYEMMSDMIVTRNPNQCRSHHQKMEKYRNAIPQIVASVVQKYEPRVFKEMQEKYIVLIKVLLENRQKYIRTPAPQKPIRYIYTNFVSNVNQVVIQKQTAQKPEIVQQNIVMEQVNRKKEEIKNTADSYDDERMPEEEDSDMDQTPVMQVVEGANSDSKQQKEPQFFNSGIQAPILMPRTQKGIPLIDKRSKMLALQTKSYYEQQLKLVKAKREWHIHTIQQLTMRLANEHDLMKDCEAAIKLYQRTLRSSEFSN